MLYHIEPMPPKVPAEDLALLVRAETATIGHFHHMGFLDRTIQALTPGKPVVGTAVTLALPGADSTVLHHALSLVRPGDILIIDRLGDDRHACWGGGVTIAAKAAGLSAAIIDGPCTDAHEILAEDFPLFARGVAPITTRILGSGGALNVPVSCGGAAVLPGDAVLADANGVLVLRPAEVEAAAREAIRRQKRGAERQGQIRSGQRKIGELSGATEKVLAGLKAQI
ncbi:RraA family protein [Agrobacterium sp. CNPSo 2736]|uniref:RraA family protein n=1 Tax=Agrobacterium sp. CNPSo 2736 TaxID=2499627 RepID=UPI000FD80560|nr:RraA family protein [Agrobacterium sp. CNPSo 2736]RVT69884.1 RraA family protein [Agrobacterium sp. CNPSo 2736]